MQKLLGAALTVLCCCTIAASCFLALSYVTFKGIGNPRPLGTLGFFVAQSGLTLGALALSRSGGVLDAFVAASGAALMWLGWSVASTTLAGPHFEGYALVMGAVGLGQGAVTIVRFLGTSLRHVPGV